MTTQLIQCPVSDGCPSYSYVGFQNPNNKYGSVTICDWDCCLYGVGTNSDSVDIPGYGTLYQPTPPALPNCETQENFSCAGADTSPCYNDPPETPTVGWNGYVDGHITYTALNDCFAKVTDATGSLLQYNPIGTILAFSNADINYGEVQSDQYAFVDFTNPYCYNSTGSNLFFVLGTPSPDNT
jgi:hypothetical protein